MLEETFKIIPPPELDMREPLPLYTKCDYYGYKCIEDHPSSRLYEIYDSIYWTLIFLAIWLWASLLTLLTFYIIFKVKKLEHPFKQALKRTWIWCIIYCILILAYIAYFYISNNF